MDLLSAMREEVRTVSRLADLIDVDERTVRLWLAKPDSRLHDDNIEKICNGARELNIELELYMSGPILWDRHRSYEENLQYDPGPAPRLGKPFKNHRYKFLGRELSSRIGASASVLTSTSMRVRYLAQTGADVLVYKTVRPVEYKPHLPPNILYCSQSEPTLDPEACSKRQIVVGDSSDAYSPAYGAMNRFGIPSRPVEVWQADFRSASGELSRSQLLILSVVGASSRDDTEVALVRGFAKVAEYALAAGAEVIELNLSCPNCAGLEGSLYHNVPLVVAICKELHNSGLKLVLKIGFMQGEELRKFFVETAGYANAFSAINSIPTIGLREGQHGPEPAWGKEGLKAGLSGKPILRCGLRCVQQLARLRSAENARGIGLIGIGGVSTPSDVKSYLDSGADIVQATTAFLADPLFGIKARRFLDKQLASSQSSAEQQLDEARLNWNRASSQLERELGGTQSTLRAVHEAALEDFLSWENKHLETISIGPRRAAPIPTAEEFKKRIRQRLARR
ncbi:MAG: hypothetical protein ACHP8B_01980 [Terriglobales bacterium]